MQDALGDKVRDALVPLVMRVDLDDRLRPMPACGVGRVNLVADVLSGDFREGARERRIFINHCPVEVRRSSLSVPSQREQIASPGQSLGHTTLSTLWMPYGVFFQTYKHRLL
jgi:hypothetical protein